MIPSEAIRQRARDLAQRTWDIPAIRARFEKLAERGIASRTLDPQDIVARKAEILDRVQFRAEEYEYFSRN